MWGSHLCDPNPGPDRRTTNLSRASRSNEGLSTGSADRTRAGVAGLMKQALRKIRNTLLHRTCEIPVKKKAGPRLTLPFFVFSIPRARTAGQFIVLLAV